MLAAARNFFADRDILEIDTPILTAFPVTDPSIECIVVGGKPDADFLRSSPEFFMKRMLAAGFPDIYEIGKVFRAGESGSRHQPEFTMIEWYRRGFTLSEIIAETTGLLECLLRNDRLVSPPVVTSYRDAFLDVLDIDPFTASIELLATNACADQRLQQSVGENRDHWLDLLMSDKVATKFDRDRLTVVRHYPASQAALAQICPEDSQVADRFEIFCGQLEVANGYVELTDAVDQRMRFLADQSQRNDRGLPVHEIDGEFLAAMESGLPACAGVSIGFERLMMINEQSEDIRSVCSFPRTEESSVT